MAMAMLARAFSLRRANQRARRKANAPAPSLVGDPTRESNAVDDAVPLSPEQNDYVHSSRVSQSIDALYVLSCLRDGLSLADAFASDGDADAARLSEERLAGRSSISLSSDHGTYGSESAWDRGFFSSPSSRSDSTVTSAALPSGKAHATRPFSKGDQNPKNSEDFCLCFRTDRRQQPLSSPSPPVVESVTSDCCSFLQRGRRSSHSEEDVRGIARKDRQSAGAAAEREVSMTISQKGENPVSETSKCASKEETNRCKQLIQVEAEEDLQRLLKKGAIEAVEKQSGNPYLDFRESMLEMMMAGGRNGRRQCRGDNAEEQEKILRRVAENSSVANDDDCIGIEDLLYCYLRLNSMELYELIAQAFSDSCSALLAMESS